MTFVKHHWFGLIISLIVSVFMLVFILVLFSPRQDMQQRGFIPCTETMASDLLACKENKILCMTGGVIKNSWCDMNVVYQGLASWISGSQKTPWANYLFEPELPPVEPGLDEAELQEFYSQTPDVGVSMQELIKQNKSLEQQVSEPEKTIEENKDEEVK